MICAGITYDDTLNEIHIDWTSADGDKGASFDTPYTMQDVYDTSTANGWGVIEKNESYYKISATIFIFNSSTYFKEVGSYLDWYETSTSSGWLIAERGTYANILLELVTVNGLKTSNDSRLEISHRGSIRNSLITGCIYVNVHESDNCIINGAYYVYANDNKFINTTVFDSRVIWVHNSLECNNVVLDGLLQGIWLDLGYTSALTTTLYNLTLVNCGYDFLFRRFQNGGYITVTLVDSIANLDSYYIYQFSENYGVMTAKMATTFKAVISEAVGANVSIIDKEGNVVYNELITSSEITPTEIVYAERIVESQNNELIGNTKNVYQPFTLVAEKTGYQTLTIPNITVTPGEPTIIRGAMVKNKAIDKNISGYVETALPESELTSETNITKIDTINTEVTL